MNTLVHAFHDHCRHSGEKLFIVDQNDDSYTYREAWERICSLAFFLKNTLHLAEQQCVMIENCQNSLFFIAFIACLLTRNIVVPVDERMSEHEKKRIFRETQSVLYITKEDSIAEFPVVFFKEIKALESKEWPLMYGLPRENDISEILFTTGTTGEPKGIVMNNAADVAVAENILYGVRMEPDNVELIVLPVNHSHALRSCFASILNGSAIVLNNGLSDLGGLFRKIDRYKVTSMDLSPGAAEMVLTLSKGKLAQYEDNIRYVEFGTSILPESIKEKVRCLLPKSRLYNFYGSTEAGRSCVLEFSGSGNTEYSVGKPTRNSTVFFTDVSRKPIDTSKEKNGLLATNGPMNMVGYWDKGKIDTNANGTVYSNDLGYIDSDGFIYVLGRRDDVINCDGIKILPEEIESVVKRYPGIVDCACVPQQDDIVGYFPVLFIQRAGEINGQDFESYLLKNLEKKKCPRRIIETEFIPRTLNGKLKRKELEEKLRHE